jgi:hypothetical protein
MRISNRQNSSLSSRRRRRSVGNLPLSSKCNMYNILCNRRRSQTISTAEGEPGQKTSV